MLAHYNALFKEGHFSLGYLLKTYTSNRTLTRNWTFAAFHIRHLSSYDYSAVGHLGAMGTRLTKKIEFVMVAPLGAVHEILKI